jgi:hypothetical protein
MKKSSLPSATAKLAMAIVGIWKLRSREDVDATGKVHIDPFLGPNPLGIPLLWENAFLSPVYEARSFGAGNGAAASPGEK